MRNWIQNIIRRCQNRKKEKIRQHYSFLQEEIIASQDRKLEQLQKHLDSKIEVRLENLCAEMKQFSEQILTNLVDGNENILNEVSDRSDLISKDLKKNLKLGDRLLRQTEGIQQNTSRSFDDVIKLYQDNIGEINTRLEGNNKLLKALMLNQLVEAIDVESLEQKN